MCRKIISSIFLRWRSPPYIFIFFISLYKLTSLYPYILYIHINPKNLSDIYKINEDIERILNRTTEIKLTINPKKTIAMIMDIAIFINNISYAKLHHD